MNKQFVINAFSENLELATKIIEREIPSVGEHEVLVKNKYVGINALYDRELYKGAVPYIDVKFPYVFGVEATGIIEAVGKGVKGYRIGDAVGTAKVGTAYQNYQLVRQNDLIDFPEASPEYLTLSTTGVSALLALERVAELKDAERVCISAAAGGLGHLLVQLCKHKNCEVLATCGSEEKVQMLTQLGCCDHILNYRTQDIREYINEKFSNKIDVAIDSVGRELFDAFLYNLAPLGRLVVVGLAAELSNGFQNIDRPRVYETIYWKGASVRCFMSHLYKQQHQEARNDLFRLYEDGLLEVKVDPSQFEGIESIKDASKYLLGGNSCGKVIVKL